MKNKIIKYLLVLFVALNPRGCIAQFSPYYHENYAAQQITPLYPFLSAMSNAIYYCYNDYNAEYTWNDQKKHYEGNLLKYFYYPEIAKAGYCVMEVYEPENALQQWQTDADGIRNTITQTERLTAQAETKKTLYRFDEKGWLRSITYENINPEYNGYILNRDSFDYAFQADGSAELHWIINKLSTGSGYAGHTACGPMPKFHKITTYSNISIRLNAYRQVTEYAGDTREQWADCKIPRERFVKKITYDSEGKPVRISDSSAETGLKQDEYTYTYTHLPLQQFLDSVKAIDKYAPFRSAAANDFFKKNDRCFFLSLNEKAEFFTDFDSKLNRPVLRKDSPLIRNDSAFFILDNARTLIAEWHDRYIQNSDPNSIRFYSHLSKQAGSEMKIDYWPMPKGQSDEPVSIKTARRSLDTVYGRQYKLYTYSSGTQTKRPVSGKGGQIFSLPGSDSGISVRPSAIALVDDLGLVRYIWGDKTFSLKYKRQANE